MEIKVILLVVSVLSSATAQLPTINSILSNFIESPNLFDGPRSISSAPLPEAPKSKRATLDQINYYSHYLAVNCPLYALDFSCTECKVIKGDIYSYKNINSFLGLRALVALSHKRKEIVVSFRGSIAPMDYILDFAFINASPASDDSNIKVHAGFFISAMSLYSEVTAAITCQLRQNPTYKIILTGHSLGGAIARCFQFYYLYNNQFAGVLMEVYTFGEPRSGNKYWADFLNNQPITTARVVNKADIVPHLPPTSVLNTTILYDHYVHVQYEVWIKSATNTTFCGYTTYEDVNCSNSLGPGYATTDHTQYPGMSECYADILNLLSPLSLISTIGKLPEIPKYLTISPTVECNFVTHLGLLDL